MPSPSEFAADDSTNPKLPFTMRRACFQDLSALIDLEAACFELYRRDSSRLIATTLRDPKREVWVVDSPQQPVVAALFLRFPRQHVRLYSIAVNPQWQGDGLGKILLQQALERAVAHDFSVLRLEVESARADLISWYERYGFVVRRTLKDFYGLNRPALQMQKNL